MTDRDPFVAALLERHTPLPADDTLDWDDVVARVHRQPARTSRRPRPVALRTGLLAAALVALLAGSALAHVGPGRFVLGLIRGDHAAPTAIKRDLRGVFHWQHGTHVLSGESRLVARLRIAEAARTSGVTQWTLAQRYIAPLADGGYCTGDLDQDPGGSTGYSYSCVHGPLRPAIRLGDDTLWAWRDAAGRLHFPPQQLDGTAPRATASVTLLRRHGASPASLSGARLPNVRYFALALTGADARTTNAPVALVARDAAGHVLARLALAAGMFRPRLISGPRSPGPSEGRIRTVSFGTFPTPGGNVSDGRPTTVRLTVEVSTRLHEATCLNVHDIARAHADMGNCAFDTHGFAPDVDTNIGLHVVFGYAPAGVRRARILLADGTALPVAVHGAAYLAVLPNAVFAAGNLPRRLVGLDAAGRTVASYRFVTTRDFPDY